MSADNPTSVEVPATPEQWRECVDSCRFWMLVDAARGYGFLTGGPDVDVERCEALLELGAAEGYHPRSDDDIVSEYVARGGFGVVRRG